MNLLPRPRSVTELGGRVPDAEPAERLESPLPSQGYRLRVDTDGVALEGADDAGLFYGRQTLAQLRRLGTGDLPAVEIADHPDLPVRAVMLDVSRDKVPTLPTLYELVDRLAHWKVNQLQLYIEHTFAYPGHPEVWAEASPYTPDDIRELDAFCRERHVELVPNRNCLGHMERWLQHPRYAHLAVSERGWTDPFGRTHPVSTLDPAHPETLPLVRELLAELLPSFSSRRVHVGCDEPFGLPRERLDSYVAHIRALRELPELADHEMLVWGEVLYRNPELLDEVPDGVTVCVWGYEASFPFQRYAERVMDAGLPFWVCPGTSSWLSLGGRLRNARGNMRTAAETATDATGYMVCDWGDFGHLQYLPVSEPPLAYGAAISWCLGTNQGLDLPSACDAHVFADEAGELGAALHDLGEAYGMVDARIPNMSALTLPLYYPDVPIGVRVSDRVSLEGITPDDLDAALGRLREVEDAVGRARPAGSDGELILEEVRQTARLLALLCRDARARLEADGAIGTVPGAVRDELASALRPMIARHRELWLSRNREGGLGDSTAWLERLLETYEAPPPA